jgi:hypothetical protein
MSDEQVTEAAGSEKGNKHPRRAPGVGFPSLPLGETVALIRKIASYGNAHSDAAVASFLGHSTANSGPFRSKLAAMRDYGLLSGKGSELTVTPLALEILHPGLDADPQASLQAAFMKCKLFATVYDALPKGLELDIEGLANTAMHNHGVASQSKEAFAASFVKSGLLAGLVEEMDTERIRIPPEGVAVSAEIEPEDAKAPYEVPVDRPQRQMPTRAILAEPTSAVVAHSWPIEGGVIRFTVESSLTLPATAYSVIGTVIEAGDKLAKMLTSSKAELGVATGDSTSSE